MNNAPYHAEQVYPEFTYEGLRFALLKDGRVMARCKQIVEPREVFRLSLKAHGGPEEPWIPAHRNFNKQVKWAVRDGVLDDMLAEREAVLDREAALRKAAPALLRSLRAVRSIDDYTSAQDAKRIRATADALLAALEDPA